MSYLLNYVTLLSWLERKCYTILKDPGSTKVEIIWAEGQPLREEKYSS